jgi:hypothetical protein
MELEVTVDREADAACVHLTRDADVKAPRQVVVDPGGGVEVVLDLDATGRLIGPEVIGAASGLREDLLSGAADITEPRDFDQS